MAYNVNSYGLKVDKRGRSGRAPRSMSSRVQPIKLFTASRSEATVNCVCNLFPGASTQYRPLNQLSRLSLKLLQFLEKCAFGQVGLMKNKLA